MSLGVSISYQHSLSQHHANSFAEKPDSSLPFRKLIQIGVEIQSQLRSIGIGIC